MRSTFKILFFVRRDRPNPDGTMPLSCRITIDGKDARFGMKTDVDPALWDTQKGIAIGRGTDASKINTLIENTKAAITGVYRDLLEREHRVSSEKVRNCFLGMNYKHQKVLELFKNHNAEVEKLVGISKSKTTYQKYEVTRKHLTGYIKQKYKLSDMWLTDIDHDFITGFETYLRTTAACGHNTSVKFIQFFKRIVIIARSNGWIVADPFANYKIRLEKVDRGFLMQDELDAIANKELKIERLAQVRDVFVFSCYSGLAYIDLANLREEHLKPGFDGKPWIKTKRHKTGIKVDVPILEPVQIIIDRYKGKQANGKVIPVLSNQKMNAYLKEIGDLCGIEERLSCHLARHTFATNLLSKGVPIESVSKMLGHTNIKTTQIYARITDPKVGYDMAILEEKLQAEKTAQSKQPTGVLAIQPLLPLHTLNSDGRFDELCLDEKLDLLHIEYTLADFASKAVELEQSAVILWGKLSEKMKRSYLAVATEVAIMSPARAVLASHISKQVAN